MNNTILSRVREYAKYSLLAPFFITLEVIMEILIPYMMAKIIDVCIKNGDIKYVTKIGIILLIMAMMSLCFGVLGARFASIASAGLSKNLRSDIFKKIQDFSFKNIDKFSSGSLVTRLTSDIRNVQMAYMMMIIMVVRSPIMMLSALFMAFKINSHISIIFLIAIPIMLIVMYTIIHRADPMFTVVFDEYDVLNNTVSENIRTQRVVKAYVREDFENKKFHKLSQKIYELFLDVEKLIALFNPSILIVLYAVIASIFLLGGRYVASSVITTGQLTSIVIYAMQIMISVISVSFVFILLIIAEASIARITEVLKEEPSMDINENGEKTVLDGSIEFKNVSFSYSDNQERLSLKNVSLRIKSGETVGIIGSIIGSSKSTFVSLIPRLYEVTDGQTLVGGKDVRDYSLSHLRDNVAMVLQKNTLFTGTVADNIRWGNENATIEEVQKVCQLACADEFMQKFPDKYDEKIYEGGNNISGGQKQRLCIARAAISDPPVLILDEATSSIDTRTEAIVQHGMDNLMHGRTVFVIAHRLSTIRNSDAIMVLENGSIIERGSHDELLMQKGAYYGLYTGNVELD